MTVSFAGYHCVLFKSYVNGPFADTSRLRVYVAHGYDSREPVFEHVGSTGNNWVQRKLDVNIESTIHEVK